MNPGLWNKDLDMDYSGSYLSFSETWQPTSACLPHHEPFDAVYPKPLMPSPCNHFQGHAQTPGTP